MNPQTKPCPHQWRHGIQMFDYGDDIFLAIGNWQNAGLIWHQMYFLEEVVGCWMVTKDWVSSFEG